MKHKQPGNAKIIVNGKECGIIKSYQLSPAQEHKVKTLLKEGEEKFGIISHIVSESSFDAGVFYEHEIEK